MNDERHVRRLAGIRREVFNGQIAGKPGVGYFLLLPENVEEMSSSELRFHLEQIDQWVRGCDATCGLERFPDGCLPEVCGAGPIRRYLEGLIASAETREARS